MLWFFEMLSDFCLEVFDQEFRALDYSVNFIYNFLRELQN